MVVRPHGLAFGQIGLPPVPSVWLRIGSDPDPPGRRSGFHPKRENTFAFGGGGGAALVVLISTSAARRRRQGCSWYQRGAADACVNGVTEESVSSSRPPAAGSRHWRGRTDLSSPAGQNFVEIDQQRLDVFVGAPLCRNRALGRVLDEGPSAWRPARPGRLRGRFARRRDEHPEIFAETRAGVNRRYRIAGIGDDIVVK